MSRGISLTREGELKVYIPNRGDGWRIRIRAHDEENMPKEIFGHRKRLVDPHNGTQGHEFIFVASPEDLVVYPANEPDVAQTPPYYRLDTIDVIVASRTTATKLWDAVYLRVCTLVAALDKKDMLRVEEIVRCGDAIPVPETSESSVSLSISESV